MAAPKTDAARIAADPSTSPAALTALARHRSRLVREAVVANPNTALATISRLAMAHPEALARNPILGWLTVETPDFLRDLPDRVRARLAMVTTTPIGLLWWLARFGSNDERQALLANSGAPEDLRAWIREQRPADKEAADGAADEELIDLLSADLVPSSLFGHLGLDRNVEAKRLLAQAADATTSLIDALLLDADDETRRFAARHPAASSAQVALLERAEAGVAVSATELAWLGQHPYGQTLVARLPGVPVEILDRLIEHDDWTVREAAAASPSLSAPHCVILATDSDRDVRAAVAANDVCPAALVEALRTDPDDKVRKAAASNAGKGNDDAVDLGVTLRRLGDRANTLLARLAFTDGNELARLAAASDWRVRQAVASNPMTPTAVLEGLSLDPDADVREATIRNTSVTEVVLRRLPTDDSAAVRAALATTTHDVALLSQLAHDDSVTVVRAVALNGSSTPDILAVAVAHCDDADVRAAVLAGRGANPTIRAAVLTRVDDPDDAAAIDALLSGTLAADAAQVSPLITRYPWVLSVALETAPACPALLDALAIDTDWRRRQMAAARPDTSRDALLRLATDPDFDVRMAVARNRSTPLEEIVRLASDDHSGVRAAVAEHQELDATIVVRLAADQDVSVRVVALRHPSCPPDAGRTERALERGEPLSSGELGALAAGHDELRLLVARHPDATGSVLRQLAADTNWRVREAAAAAPNTPIDALESLAADPDRDVRRALLSHPRVAVLGLERFVTDADASVRRAALRHPALAGPVRDRVVVGLLLRLSRSRSGLTLAVVASSPLLSARELGRRRFWQAPDWRVRRAVVHNPSTPPEIIERLRADADPRVWA